MAGYTLVAPVLTFLTSQGALLPAPSSSITLSCLLGSFPLQASDAVVKVDVVSVSATRGPWGKKNHSLTPVPGQRANFMDLALLP